MAAERKSTVKQDISVAARRAVWSQIAAMAVRQHGNSDWAGCVPAQRGESIAFAASQSATAAASAASATMVAS
jgi:hypothetical protein